VLSIGAVPERPVVLVPFFDRMRELGYEDGHSVVYVRGFAAGHTELIETMVREVIAAKPVLLVVTGAVEALASNGSTRRCRASCSSPPIRSGQALFPVWLDRVVASPA
jgi:hypothetical protein